MSTVIENWESIFTVVGVVLSFVAPGLAALWWRSKIVVRELVQAIDKAPVPNNIVKAAAVGKPGAAKALAVLDN